MNPVIRVVSNVLFAVGFLTGLVFVWIGIGELVFGSQSFARSLISLAVGFAIWVALGEIADLSGRRIGGRA